MVVNCKRCVYYHALFVGLKSSDPEVVQVVTKDLIRKIRCT